MAGRFHRRADCPIHFYPISIVERDVILEKCREIQPDAVASIGSDLAMLTVNYVAGKLGLPCNSMECTEISTNKYAMRKAFRTAGRAGAGLLRGGCGDNSGGSERTEAPGDCKTHGPFRQQGDN